MPHLKSNTCFPESLGTSMH